MKRISILSFTMQGAEQSSQVAQLLKGMSQQWLVRQYEKTSHPVLPPENQILMPLTDWCREAFQTEDVILFIGAVGIAIRSIAPSVADKFTDPAVLVMDETGKFIIPMLSGHIGGANAFAGLIAKELGAEPVITTATDLHHLFAVDTFAQENHLIIGDRQQAKEISASLLMGEKVYWYLGDKAAVDVDKIQEQGTLMCKKGVVDGNSIPPELTAITRDEFCRLQEGFENPRTMTAGCDLSQEARVITVTDEIIKRQQSKAHICQLIPRCHILGLGCRKEIDMDVLEHIILQTLETQNITLESVAAIATIDIKKDEKAICEFSEKYQIPMEIFTAEELMQVEGDFTESDFVRAQTGTDNVCERAAIAGMCQYLTQGSPTDVSMNRQVEKGIKLTMKKQAGKGVTLAIASKEWSVKLG